MKARDERLAGMQDDRRDGDACRLDSRHRLGRFDAEGRRGIDNDVERLTGRARQRRRRRDGNKVRAVRATGNEDHVRRLGRFPRDAFRIARAIEDHELGRIDARLSEQGRQLRGLSRHDVRDASARRAPCRRICATARLTARVVFPAPPFSDRIATTFMLGPSAILVTS